jgi:flagellin
MALYIQTNVSSLVAQTHLAGTQRALNTSFARLASGYRINNASDDAAGLGIAKSLEAQVRSYSVAERNANNGISMAQTADGGADQISNMMSRMRELAVQGADGSLSASDRTNLGSEFSALQASIDRVANVTKFNGVALLTGASSPISFQTGIGTSTSDQISVSFGGADSTSLKVDAGSIDLTSTAKAQAAITAIDLGIQSLSTVREGFGAGMNALQDTVSNLQTSSTNMAASLSRIRDVDVASETAALAREQVLSQAGASVLGQANQAPQLALGLLRGQ